jgi:CHRD domain
MNAYPAKRKLLGILAVASAAALLGSCASMKAAETGQQITLSGTSEVPANQSMAKGNGTVNVMPDGSVTATVSVTGMTATAAHIHVAAAGANGPVIVPFTKISDNSFVAPDNAKMTPEQYASYKAGNTYVNVHSAQFPGGEIRAQLAGK